VNGPHPRAAEEPRCGISGILLEHAQREISRSSISSPQCDTGVVGELSFDPPSAAGPSSLGSNAMPSTSGVKPISDDRSCEFSQPLQFLSAGQNAF
jgi:hypothetical protein